jgi:hypothetical protein
MSKSFPSRGLNRRDWLKWGAACVGMPLTMLSGRVAAQAADDLTRRKRAYLKRFLYSRDDLDACLAGKGFYFSRYDAEVGYVHTDRDYKEGMDGSICSYRYDKTGARRTIAHADKACRINTYGNSFTSCEQVSDGETWQEILAAHLGEPLRNFGTGAYSVYLAYLRMMREEKRWPAEYIIFNIYDDDHYRNLLPWQRARFGVNRKSIGPTMPYVSVNPEAGDWVEHPNPCPTAEDLYDLCDEEGAWRMFKDDYLLERYVQREKRREQKDPQAPANDYEDEELTRHALFASMRIVEKVEEFAANKKRVVLYVLSYSSYTIRRWLNDGHRFDQSFVNFFNQRQLPCVDLLKAHIDDYAKFAPGVDAYLKQYFIGHYNPLGNHFCAFALKDKLLGTLKPTPPAYDAERAGG